MDNSELERWRAMDAHAVLLKLAGWLKADQTYVPTTPGRDSVRVHVSAAGSDWELLLTGAKWYDTRSRVGGGGAIDLVMHVWDMRFRDAVKYLRASGL